MTMLPMMKQCPRCKKMYSWNPDVGNMWCPRCGPLSMSETGPLSRRKSKKSFEGKKQKK